MKKIICTFYFLSSFIYFLFAQGNTNILEKGGDEVKLFNAGQSFNGGDYRTALNKYKEVLKNRPTDASVNYHIGECYFMMHDYKSALEFLEKAKSISPSASSELSLTLGRTYHIKGMVDKALEELNAYKKSLGDNATKIKDSEIDLYLAQCNLAKQMMSKPVNVKVVPLQDLNSQYEDKGPVLDPSGKILYFTSRRPSDENKSIVDKEGDFGFFDDVYESHWNEETKTWSAADMMRGPINTDGYDALSSISGTCNLLFLYRNNPSEARGGEIYMAKKATSGKWKTPEILLKPVNTSYYEDAACIAPDCNTLYFVSERPGGLGHGDIYTSKSLGDGKWSEPINLGAPVNSAYDENGLFLTPDGKTLFFCSNGPGSIGSYDIFKSTLGADGKWSTPVNLGYPINTTETETKFVLSPDNKTAYISSVRDTGLGERDIYMVDLSNYPVINEEVKQPVISAKSIVKGMVSNSEAAQPMAVEIKILDKTSKEEVAKAMSGADGNFSFELAHSKTYMIEISTEGFQKVSEEFTLPMGKDGKPFVLVKNLILNKNK